MQKRGQITLFVIIGILILVVVGLFLFFRENSRNQSDMNSLMLEKFNPYVKSCLKEIGEKALLYVTRHGGYYKIPNEVLKSALLDIPYYSVSKNKYIPSVNRIEDETSGYINENIKGCLSSISLAGNSTDFELLAEGVSVEIDYDKVKLALGYNLFINGSSYQKFNLEAEEFVDSDIKDLHKLSEDLVDYYSKNNIEGVCITCLEDLSKSNFIIEVSPSLNLLEDPDSLTLSLISKRTKEEFRFLIKK
ncbi:MAG: hypothetical protein PHG05_00310 [Candidatus Nanoarchaeia archaeon]|nr:hypothetical protein [Candidatus Nanoarchaeia archaeon]